MFSLSPLELEAIQLSLKVSLWAVAISLPFGIAVAWVLARCEFPGKSLFDALIHVPLVVPPVVIGYLLLVLLGASQLGGDPAVWTEAEPSSWLLLALGGWLILRRA